MPFFLFRRTTVKGCKSFTKQQISDASKLKEFSDDNFKFDENGKKFSKRVENIVGKEAISHFSQCFQKTCTADM